MGCISCPAVGGAWPVCRVVGRRMGVMAGAFGLVGCEADRPGRGVAEEHLRHGLVVGR